MKMKRLVGTRKNVKGLKELYAESRELRAKWDAEHGKGLTHERMKQAIYSTWQVVAHDFEQACADAGEEMRMSDAAENVLDYVAEYGGLTKEEKALWAEVKFKYKLKAAKEVVR